MLSGRKHDKIWFMEEIKKQLQQAIKKVLGQEIEPELTVPPAETGADYATNVAMRLAKPLRKAPMLIAEELKVELESSLSGVKIEVAAPLAAMKKPIRGKIKLRKLLKMSLNLLILYHVMNTLIKWWWRSFLTLILLKYFMWDIFILR